MRKIELINLTLDEIRRSAQMVSDVYIDSVHCNKGEENYLFKRTIKECDEALERCRIELREVLESIAEFQNAKDMVCPVDMALTETAYDLIYERKTEHDF